MSSPQFTHSGTSDLEADIVSSLQGLYDTTLALLEQALHLWPGTNVRMHYVDKLLSANKAQQLNPPPALLTGLHVMSLVLTIQVRMHHSTLGLTISLHGVCQVLTGQLPFMRKLPEFPAKATWETQAVG